MEKCEKHFDEAQPCSNILSKHAGYPRTPQCLSSVSCTCSMLDSKVRPIFFFTHVAWGLPGLGDGIHIAPLLPRASVKWPWGKEDQRRILLDVESFWQAFINLSFKTQAPFPSYVFYGETDEWLTVIATRREIPWFGVNLPEACYQYPNSLTCLASVCHCKRTTVCSKHTNFWLTTAVLSKRWSVYTAKYLSANLK